MRRGSASVSRPPPRHSSTPLGGRAALLEALWAASREITRITYNLDAWNSAPRRIRIQDRTVRLGGFHTSDPRMVRLSDAWGRERIDVLVIPPATDAAVADRALMLAGEADSAYRGDQILSLAAVAADHARTRAA